MVQWDGVGTHPVETTSVFSDAPSRKVMVSAIPRQTEASQNTRSQQSAVRVAASSERSEVISSQPAFGV